MTEAQNTNPYAGMKFSELLDEYLEQRASEPSESNGYTYKDYYKNLRLMREQMDALVMPASNPN